MDAAIVQMEADEEIVIQRVDITGLSVSTVCAHPTAPHAIPLTEGNTV